MSKEEFELVREELLADSEAGELMLRYLISGREESSIFVSEQVDQVPPIEVKKERLESLLTEIRNRFPKQSALDMKASNEETSHNEASNSEVSNQAASNKAASNKEVSKRAVSTKEPSITKGFLSVFFDQIRSPSNLRVLAVAAVVLICCIPALYLALNRLELPFITRGNPVEAVLTLAPNGIIHTTMPVFEWKEGSSDVLYQLTILDDAFEERFHASVQANRYAYKDTDPKLAAGVLYYWEIKWEQDGKQKSARASFEISRE